jgi:hypothetical protein
MLQWADADGGVSAIRSSVSDSLESIFENHVRESVTLDSATAESLKSELRSAFGEYADRLG